MEPSYNNGFSGSETGGQGLSQPGVSGAPIVSGGDAMPGGGSAMPVAPAPISSGTGDVVLAPAGSGSSGPRRGVIIGIVAGAVALVLMVVLGMWTGGVFGGGGSGAAVTEESLAEKMGEDFGTLASYQKLYVGARAGDFSAEGFFSEETKNLMTEITQYMNGMAAYLNGLNVNGVEDEWARENLQLLREAINGDLYIYDDTLALYNLFYEYVNGGYRTSDAVAITELGLAAADTTLANLDATVLETEGYEEGTIVQDLFAVYVPEDWPEEHYFTYAGRVLAGVTSESEENEEE